MLSPLDQSAEPKELVLYTDALITRGYLRTRQHRVTDMLNQSDEPFLILENVTVEEYRSRGQPIRAEFAQVNLDAVLFAVANDPVPTMPELRTPKTPEQAIISVPPFSIVGTIHLMPMEGSIREALHELTGRFLPVTDAMFWSDHLGEPREQALLVAINHHRAHILAPHREVDPWAGLGGSQSGGAVGGAGATGDDAGYRGDPGQGSVPGGGSFQR
jgi:hypothetical protein